MPISDRLPLARVRELAECSNPGPYLKSLAREVLDSRERIAALFILRPLDLCAYLAKLILPPGDDPRLLVPFSGSGSEIMGALRSGWAEVVGIDNDAEYVELSRRRIEGDAPMLNSEAARLIAPDPPIPQNGELFGRVLGAQDEAKDLALSAAPKESKP